MSQPRLAMLCTLIALILASAVAHGADDLAFFEKKARLSKELGATSVTITDELPPAMWQFNPKNDPYPGWFIYRPGLLKIFPPKEVQPFVNTQYAEKVAGILAARCKILRKYALRATFDSNEPQTLPEAFAKARGALVDRRRRQAGASAGAATKKQATLQSVQRHSSRPDGRATIA